MRKPLPGVGRALPVFCFALICNATLVANANLQQPRVRLANPLPAERSRLAASLRARAARLQDPSVPREIPIDVLQIYGLPLGISNASFRHNKKGDWLKLSIANSANEQILSIRYWLLVFDSANKVRSVVDQSESLKIEAYGAKAVSLPAPPRAKTVDDDRVFLVLAQVIGRDSIWEVQQAKTALLAYVKGDSYSMPSVLRLLNQVDSPIGFSPILLKPRQ